jgi:hypothetical protein
MVKRNLHQTESCLEFRIVAHLSLQRAEEKLSTENAPRVFARCLRVLKPVSENAEKYQPGIDPSSLKRKKKII